uniref:Uncharacterized protein n=1 Tax=Oryza rufipogon TaxID=4529 RepID=A0A0E0QN52_ORYRU
MAVVVPANSGEGNGPGKEGERGGGGNSAWGGRERRRAVRLAAAEQRVTPGGGTGGIPATDWMGKERGKGVLGMENPFLPSISEDLRCMRRIWELYQWRKFRVSGIFPPVMTI